MGFLNFGFGAGFLIDLAFAWHIIRTGRSPLWIIAIVLLGPIGWGIYIVFAILPDAAGSTSARRFADNVVSAADPGRSYREKLRDVERVGSADSKRALADECIRMGRFADAVELYENAMQGPIGQDDVTLIKGLARAKMLSGDGAAAETLFLKLKALDPNAFDADAELDYARALALQGKNEAAMRQYEQVVNRYPGEEARCRFGLLLESMEQQERAQALFREILKSVKGAPSYYRRRQREWTDIARQHLR